VAVLEGETVGYISLRLNLAPLAAWATDLVVKRRLRRQGIGSALVLAAQEWGAQHGSRNLVLEMQPKNYPAIHMAHKLGFDFCGYNDRYYANHDIGLFFAKSLR
jgi:ribosomal protein S18 acetylase RimI-like enzyme